MFFHWGKHVVMLKYSWFVKFRIFMTVGGAR
jgi:hypothetical protein